MGQITCGAEDDNCARLRHRAGAQTFAQRIVWSEPFVMSSEVGDIPWLKPDKLTYRDSFQPSHKAAA